MTTKKARSRTRRSDSKKTTVTSGRASPICRDLLAGGESAKRAAGRIKKTLARSKGRIDHAADSLGVTPRTLSRWLKDYGLQSFASELRTQNEIPGPRP